MTPQRQAFLREQFPSDTVSYQGGEREITLERMVRSCFNGAGLDFGGLTEVLRHSYGGFAKIFEKDHVVTWTLALAYAARGPRADARRFRRATKLLQEFEPIGVASRGTPGFPPRPYVFIE
jgi:hypothetical protein